MSSFNPYAAGRKVYASGSYAPTRGQVDPRGYIQRGLRSERRSGLAQRALNTLRGQTPVGAGSMINGPKPSKPPVGAGSMANGPKPPKVGAGASQGPNPPKAPVVGAGGSMSEPGAKPGVGAGHGGENGDPEQPQKQPFVLIGKNGQLNLPYTKDVSWEVLNATNDMNEQLLDLQTESQQQQLEYNTAKRDGRKQQGAANTQLLNDAAASGNAFSSAYGVQYLKQASDFSDMFTDLDNMNQQYQQGVITDRMGIENAFQNMLMKAGLLTAEGLVPEAGGLGLGRGKNNGTNDPGVDTKEPKPPVKPPKTPDKKDDKKDHRGHKNHKGPRDNKNHKGHKGRRD